MTRGIRFGIALLALMMIALIAPSANAGCLSGLFARRNRTQVNVTYVQAAPSQMACSPSAQATYTYTECSLPPPTQMQTTVITSTPMTGSCVNCPATATFSFSHR